MVLLDNITQERLTNSGFIIGSAFPRGNMLIVEINGILMFEQDAVDLAYDRATLQEIQTRNRDVDFLSGCPRP